MSATLGGIDRRCAGSNSYIFAKHNDNFTAAQLAGVAAVGFIARRQQRRG